MDISTWSSRNLLETTHGLSVSLLGVRGLCEGTLWKCFTQACIEATSRLIDSAWEVMEYFEMAVKVAGNTLAPPSCDK